MKLEMRLLAAGFFLLLLIAATCQQAAAARPLDETGCQRIVMRAS